VPGHVHLTYLARSVQRFQAVFCIYLDLPDLSSPEDSRTDGKPISNVDDGFLDLSMFTRYGFPRTVEAAHDLFHWAADLPKSKNYCGSHLVPRRPAELLVNFDDECINLVYISWIGMFLCILRLAATLPAGRLL